ncbi:hypothetical protein BJ912DRAFT_979953 [Pholiota molesta]|nr:hypothetical protein BJ912DRAFT_979953 [Pholiota molesta]
MSIRCQECKFLSDPSKYLCDLADPNFCGPCTQLLEMDTKIKEIRLMLVGLVCERQKLKEQVNYNHDRLIHRLPPEIVADIFAFCIPADAMDIDLQHITFDSRQVIRAPLILSAVCRYWRTIAHAAPQLWQTLFLCPLTLSSHSFPQPRSIQKWIDRAGSLPLSISLHVSHEAMHDGIHITSVLNRCANRWVKFKYAGHSELLKYLTGDGQDLSQLRTLHLIDSSHRTKTELNLHPQRLRSLSISRIQLIQINVDWQHITHLEMECVTLSDCFEALRRAPCLTHYTLRQPSRDYGIGPEGGHIVLPQNPIVHSNIQYLEFVQTLLYKKIFEHSSCSSLMTLVIDFTQDLVEMPLIVDFLRKSGCSLETFSLVYAKPSTSDLVALCQGVPTLQHLHIDFCDASPVPSLFALLAEFSIVNGRKEPRHLPALRSFDLDMLMVCDASVTPMVHDWTMLPNIFGTPVAHSPEATERHRHALESVAISVRARVGSNSDGVVDGETLKRILWLREAGVKWKIVKFEDVELAGDLCGVLLPWAAVESI